jgi:hypothetical protein
MGPEIGAAPILAFFHFPAPMLLPFLRGRAIAIDNLVHLLPRLQDN